MTRVPYAGDEHALDGGNVAAGVVRVGDTVRKPAGFWTPAVEALLSHLWRVGFTGAPRPLGRDGEGRHVLEYVPGPMAMDQPWLDEAGLHRVGRLIRELHDASAGFFASDTARTKPCERGRPSHATRQRSGWVIHALSAAQPGRRPGITGHGSAPESQEHQDGGRCTRRADMDARDMDARDMDARLDRLRNRLEESRAIAEIAARHLRRLVRR